MRSIRKGVRAAVPVVAGLAAVVAISTGATSRPEAADQNAISVFTDEAVQSLDTKAVGGMTVSGRNNAVVLESRVICQAMDRFASGTVNNGALRGLEQSLNASAGRARASSGDVNEFVAFALDRARVSVNQRDASAAADFVATECSSLDEYQDQDLLRAD
jgi:hypothetical protein